MKNTFKITGLLALGMLAACSGTRETQDVQTPFGMCHPVSGTGLRGDFNVMCPATDQLMKISKQTPDAAFLSEVGFGGSLDRKTILVNVIPNGYCGSGITEYRVLANGITNLNIPSTPGKYWAVSYCPGK